MIKNIHNKVKMRVWGNSYLKKYLRLGKSENQNLIVMVNGGDL